MGRSKLRRKAARAGNGRPRAADPAVVLNEFMECVYAGGGVYPIGSIDIQVSSSAAPAAGPVFTETVRLFHVFGHLDMGEHSVADHPLADTLLLVDIAGRPQLAVPGMALVASLTQLPDPLRAKAQATLEGAETILARHRVQDTTCPICHVSPSRSVH